MKSSRWTSSSGCDARRALTFKRDSWRPGVADLVKKIAVATAIFAATAAKAEVITKDNAYFFGYLIVSDAACEARFATLEMAKFVNRGAKLKDFMALKTDIVQGKEGAKASLAEKGKQAFCHKLNSTPEINSDHASDARVLGWVAAKDELCGTHIYKAAMGGMKKRGELYPGMLNDYAEEYAEGKRLQVRVFKREGETKFCRDDRRMEREDADFERITRALGVYEAPSNND